ncbi:MAG: SoxR reducing system RseC family protein [Clostridia bacterium]|nr:SoxR reducing system RseC family protein [Clostridia bacterium]
MRQKAIVLQTYGNRAKVRVLRSSMCEGCSKKEDGGSCACGALLGANRVMDAEAENAVRAEIGDAVEIETESSVVLGYAALVFLLPVLLFFFGYTAAQGCSELTYIPWIVGAGCFLLSFIPVLMLEKHKRKTVPQIRIVSILPTEPEEKHEV